MASDLYDADYGSAYYRTRDPIKNIRIKVHLEKSGNCASTVPQIAPLALSGPGEALELQKFEKAAVQTQAQQDIEEYEFRWQEKVFCQREVDKYANAQICSTVLERKYHEDVLDIQKSGGKRPTRRLFSYVDHDSFTNSDEHLKKFTNSPTEQPTLLAEQMETVRHRRGGANRNDCRKPLMTTNVVTNNPSEDLKKQNRLISSAGTTMYIMADLAPVTRTSTENDEIVLCTIKIDGSGVLTLKPDFNKGRKPYNIGGAVGLGHELYQYTLEHASAQLSRQEQEKEYKMYKEMYSRHFDFLQICVGSEFQMTQADDLRVTIFGELEAAKNFEYNCLYVHWFVDLPDGWMPNCPQPLSGVTQCCSTKSVGKDEVAYFSLPFNLDLLYRRNPFQEKSAPDSTIDIRWPQLFVEVLSLDSWQRYRTEGYGYMTLPYTPGTRSDDINCWRPSGRSLLAELRRFFIGCSPELEDPSYIAVPSTYEGSHLSKFGFRSISTGVVVVKTNTILQSQAFIHSATTKRKQTSVIDKIGFSVKQAAILNVLDAFQRAKQRMIAARENLKRDFVETLRAQTIADESAHERHERHERHE